MFNRLFFLIYTTIALQTAVLYAKDTTTPSAPPKVKWFTNYQEAVEASKSSSKPLALFFTGSDWCGWCLKLEDEAFDTKEFVENAGDKFIFVKLDFPFSNPQDPAIKEQNMQLQEKFAIQSFPTVVLFDTKQNKQIAILGYRSGGGQAFADHLNRLVRDYNEAKSD